MGAQSQDIAIIGMAGIYPGASTVDTLWSNIVNKIEAVSDAPASWNAGRFHNPDADSTSRAKTYCQRGGFIEPFAEFDPLEFGIMPNSVDGSDPGHFMTLRVAREALSDAGYLNKSFDRTRVGVVIGHGSYPHRGMHASGAYGVIDHIFELLRDVFPELPADVAERVADHVKSRMPPFTPDTCPGLISNVLAGRIANRLDLMGPNYLVDAACASSLIALDAGMRDLRDNRCDMMLVGGAQENSNAGVFIVFSMLGALSKRGKLRPFDKNADGTLLGEGIGFSVIKRLADAKRDGDRIYAVIKGIGLSSDGQGQAFLVPRLEGEVLAMERAYAAAGISPETIELVEAHGTGTAVGDRTEVQAMTQIFGVRNGKLPRCAVGSVKSMISHTIPASGMASIFKTSLALYHKTLPPTLCEEPNPELGIEKSALYVNTETRPWIHGQTQPRRAGVSAFGFGGINSHVVLEEYTPDHATETLLRNWPAELIVLRGDSRDALLDKAREAKLLLTRNPAASLRDLAFTASGNTAQHSGVCLALVAESASDLGAKLDAAIAAIQKPGCDSIQDRSGIYFFTRPLAHDGKLAFLLPGEGAQYAGMLADLCIHFEEVRQWFDRADRAFLERGREPLPSQIVFPPTHITESERESVNTALWSMDYALPLITVADGALYHLMILLGVMPQALAGHSTAQDLAIEAAAGFDRTTPDNVMYKPVLEERILDESLLKSVPEAKLMSVGASEPGRVAELVKESNGALFVAMDNCPNQIVICGAPDAIKTARIKLSDEGALCQFLPFDRGYHTPMYQPVCDQLERTTTSCEERVPKIPVYCTTTAQQLPDAPSEIRRIMIDQWTTPIRFRETIEKMYEDGIRIFLEVGPRGNLTGFVDDILAGRDYAAIPCNLASRGGLVQLLHALALLSAHGVPVNLGRLFERRKPTRLTTEEIPSRSTPKSRPSLKLKMDIPIISFDEADRKALRESILTSLSIPNTAPVTTALEPPPELNEDSAIMQAHLRTMDRILEAHEELMRVTMSDAP